MASLGMLLSPKRTDQKFWMLKFILLVTSTSAASLAQGIVVIASYIKTHVVSPPFQAV